MRLNTDYISALARVNEALKTEGYGVLTEIDVKDTLKKKLGVDFRFYKILGACNPSLAHRALTIAPETGLLLPCNVTISQAEDGVTEVALIDPLAMLGIIPNPDLRPIAEEAKARLDRVAAALRN
ncbi:MAG: ABC transporter ATP-binding protein [Chloroflexi bacterium RBG_16_56_8]|nr:MAG: ABC transporter ATP-binding protein [Chloroflexi bacterium RBG_16_56_8]